MPVSLSSAAQQPRRKGTLSCGSPGFSQIADLRDLTGRLTASGPGTALGVLGIGAEQHRATVKSSSVWGGGRLRGSGYSAVPGARCPGEEGCSSAFVCAAECPVCGAFVGATPDCCSAGPDRSSSLCRATAGRSISPRNTAASGQVPAPPVLSTEYRSVAFVWQRAHDLLAIQTSLVWMVAIGSPPG